MFANELIHNMESQQSTSQASSSSNVDQQTREIRDELNRSITPYAPFVIDPTQSFINNTPIDIKALIAQQAATSQSLAELESGMVQGYNLTVQNSNILAKFDVAIREQTNQISTIATGMHNIASSVTSVQNIMTGHSEILSQHGGILEDLQIEKNQLEYEREVCKLIILRPSTEMFPSFDGLTIANQLHQFQIDTQTQKKSAILKVTPITRHDPKTNRTTCTNIIVVCSNKSERDNLMAVLRNTVQRYKKGAQRGSDIFRTWIMETRPKIFDKGHDLVAQKIVGYRAAIQDNFKFHTRLVWEKSISDYYMNFIVGTGKDIAGTVVRRDNYFVRGVLAPTAYFICDKEGNIIVDNMAANLDWTPLNQRKQKETGPRDMETEDIMPPPANPAQPTTSTPNPKSQGPAVPMPGAPSNTEVDLTTNIVNQPGYRRELFTPRSTASAAAPPGETNNAGASGSNAEGFNASRKRKDVTPPVESYQRKPFTPPQPKEQGKFSAYVPVRKGAPPKPPRESPFRPLQPFRHPDEYHPEEPGAQQTLKGKKGHGERRKDVTRRRKEKPVQGEQGDGQDGSDDDLSDSSMSEVMEEVL